MEILNDLEVAGYDSMGLIATDACTALDWADLEIMHGLNMAVWLRLADLAPGF